MLAQSEFSDKKSQNEIGKIKLSLNFEELDDVLY
jgi:acyl-CoA reductase-like NAD-dependent aldehyde dehydrogenase